MRKGKQRAQARKKAVVLTTEQKRVARANKRRNGPSGVRRREARKGLQPKPLTPIPPIKLETV
jgi:hypothetical protein